MWTKLWKFVRQLLTREEGPTAVEYAVLLALIVAVCILAIQLVGANTNQAFGDVGASIGASSGTSSGSPTCFVAGTVIQTIDGSMPIEQIGLGMKVWSWNEESQQFEFQEVVQLIRGKARSLVTMEVSDQPVVCTENHPFLLADGTWKRAGALKPGDRLFAMDGSRAVVMSHARKTFAEPVPVFNLGVAETHTYCITGVGFVVHNVKAP